MVMRQGGSLIAFACVLIAGCVGEAEPSLRETAGEISAANKLAANKLAANKLAANKLAASKLASTALQTSALVQTPDGREVLSFVVGCALPAGASVSVTHNKASYTFPGWIGLAPNWAIGKPTVAQRRWVTACVLARTNLYGLPVEISMRHDTNLALASTAYERDSFLTVEGAF